jgi:hypothetical protein
VVGVAGQHVHDGEADLLGHVLGDLRATAVGAEAGTGVAVDRSTHGGDEQVDRDDLAGARTGDEVTVREGLAEVGGGHRNSIHSPSGWS